MLQSRSCIKFTDKQVRQRNFQYEVNNCAELDNGVIHQMQNSPANSLKGL
jgi:hypothetical protein